tara:strand:+ start:121 stop:345 length:225 start_codon:yes stop_codon:yes gene_type:complete
MKKSKSTKRAEAEQRQAARALRTNQEQIAKLDRAGHAAKRERARLFNASLLSDIDHDDDIQRQKDFARMNKGGE